MQVPDAGGDPTPLTSPMDEQHRQPVFLPDGRALLFTIIRPNQPSQIAALDIDTGEWKDLVQGSSARYSETGHLIFLRENALWAVAFDPTRLEVSGDPVPVLEGVGRQTNSALFDIAANGTLVYTPASGESRLRTLVWVDRNGREEAITTPVRAYDGVRLSPDGTSLALEARDEETDIWIWHLVRRTLTRLTFDRAGDGAPEWTPDGRRIVFASDREGGVVNLYWQPADGTGSTERLTDGLGTQFPTQVSPDGMVALFADQRDGPADLLAVSLTRPEGASGPREITTLLKTPFVEQAGVVSPDGRWLAYESNASGRFEIYVRPYPDVSGGQWQVSPSGGQKPRWSRDARELFFVNERTVMAVRVEPGPGWTAGVPQAVVKGPYAFERPRPYDVSLDGKRFVLTKEDADASVPSGPTIVVVENWAQELRSLVK
jgi:serine/threonine-protein kinase